MTSLQRTFRAFRHYNFRLYFGGQFISLIGSWAHSTALSWLIWRMTQSSLLLGVIGFSSQFPILLLGLFGGVIADRWNRHRILLVAQTLAMIASFLLVFLMVTHKLNLWNVAIISFFLGIVFAFEFPARLTFLMDVVGRGDLLNAISLHSAMFHISRMIGPVAAGFIVAWKDESLCFLFDGFTFLIFIVTLLMMRRSDLMPMEIKQEQKHVMESICEGIRYAWRDPTTRLEIFLVIIMGSAGFSFIALMPVFADHIYGGSSIEFGGLMAASGMGAMVSALSLARREHSSHLLSVATKSMILFSLLLLVFSQIKILWMGISLLFILGFFMNRVVAHQKLRIVN